MKLKAQNVIEFTFVFIAVMSIFFTIIELSLYLRAQYSVQNIANEIVANLQIVAQNASSEEEIMTQATQIVKQSAGLLNLGDSNYTLSGSNGDYTISSDFQKQGASALVAIINLDENYKSEVTAGVTYTYSGIFLYRNGKALSSGAVQSIQKF